MRLHEIKETLMAANEKIAVDEMSSQDWIELVTAKESWEKMKEEGAENRSIDSLIQRAKDMM